jgi:hypothetical protein
MVASGLNEPTADGGSCRLAAADSLLPTRCCRLAAAVWPLDCAAEAGALPPASQRRRCNGEFSGVDEYWEDSRFAGIPGSTRSDSHRLDATERRETYRPINDALQTGTISDFASRTCCAIIRGVREEGCWGSLVCSRDTDTKDRRLGGVRSVHGAGHEVDHAGLRRKQRPIKKQSTKDSLGLE